MVIFYDKLLELGGAEAVLKELVLGLRPDIIYTSCINKDIDWESIYKTKILSPKGLSWINSQYKFRIFYPFVCLLTYFYKIDKASLDKVVIYSSTTAKFFSIKGAKKVVFYSNYPLKPLIHFGDFLNPNDWYSPFKLFLFNIVKKLWTKIELYQLKKYPEINVISKLSKKAYIRLYGDSLPDINIIHCPTNVNLKDLPTIDRKDGNNKKHVSICIVSRLYNEKTLPMLLKYFQSNDTVTVNVIGDGPLLTFFKSEFTKINFCGYLPESDKLRIIKTSDIVFVPTAQEWSIVTIEANLVGTPVIAKYSEAIEEINKIISNSINQPNLMYKNINEIDQLIPLVYEGRKILKENKLKYTKYFSNTRFVPELSDHFKDI